MSKSIRGESPLVASGLPARTTPHQGAGVLATERPFLGHLNLRGDPADPAFLVAVKDASGCGLPLTPNTVAMGCGLTIFWLGPNEWLLLTPGAQATDTAKNLRKSLEGLFAAVTVTSGGQTVIALGGERAYDLLAKGCCLDLHPRMFGPGRCAQTHLAKASVLIHQLDDAPTFELIVQRSFADYLWRWLLDASEEYGLTVIPETVITAPIPAVADFLNFS